MVAYVRYADAMLICLRPSGGCGGIGRAPSPGMRMKLPRWLKLREADSIRDLDDRATTLVHARIIRRKYFLNKIYAGIYRQFRDTLGDAGETGLIVELGSGGGFIKDLIPRVVTSDILDLPHLDRRFSALDMPFDDGTVDAFFMWGVLHHLPDARAFFSEVTRCLKTGGKILMVESACTPWSRFIYRRFHHEPMDTSGGWALEKTGRLSTGNLALPWIIFYRDRKLFEREFPSLRIVELKPHAPFSYLLSGGLSYRQLAPSFAYPLVKGLELLLAPWNGYLGTLLTIELHKEP